MKLMLVLAFFPMLAACAVSVSPTATSEPTTIPLSQQVTLVSVLTTETSQDPPFTINSQTPKLTGSNDPRVLAFNQRLEELVTKEVDSFRQDFQENTTQMPGNGSFLEVTYVLVSQITDIWSIKFDFSFYYDGAAHPGLYSITVTYDLDQGRELALGDIFLPNSGYLEAISFFCISELNTRNPDFADFVAAGAAPTPDNYRNWNIAEDGLMITFDEYQVAPYAAGPQTIVVPWSGLLDIVNRDVVSPEIVP